MPRGFKQTLKIGKPPKMEKGIPPVAMKLPKSKAMPFAQGSLTKGISPISVLKGGKRKV